MMVTGQSQEENCLDQIWERLFCEDASVCRDYKAYVFFLMSSNKILKGSSLASDCLVPTCVIGVFEKVTCTPTKRCLFWAPSVHSETLSHGSCWYWNGLGNVRARGEGLCSPVGRLFLDVSRLSEAITAQNTCRILSSLTEPLSGLGWHLRGSLCSLKRKPAYYDFGPEFANYQFYAQF